MVKPLCIKKCDKSVNAGINQAPFLEGKIVASIGAYQNGLSSIMHTNKMHVIHRDEGHLRILPLDDNNGRILTDKIIVISNEHLKESSVKRNFLIHSLEIITQSGQVRYRQVRRLSPTRKKVLNIG